MSGCSQVQGCCLLSKSNCVRYRDYVLSEMSSELRDCVFGESAASGHADLWLRLADLNANFNKLCVRPQYPQPSLAITKAADMSFGVIALFLSN